jgi:hypothetical protein
VDPSLLFIPDIGGLDPSLLFIPDISGFTKFVNDTEVAHGQHIVSELLELIIDSDELGLTLSEVEGDAVLFYKLGEVPSFASLLRQAQVTFEAFHGHLKAYEAHRICDCGACRTAHQLSLKFVAHQGPFQLLDVRGFQKPYGKDVILAHRLLKNDVPEPEYLLATSGFPDAETPSDLPDWAQISDGAGAYDDLGEVGYRFVSLTPLLDAIPDPPPPAPHDKSDRPVVQAVTIARPLAEVYELLTNFDFRLLWNRSVDDLRYEPNRVNRVGTRHHCVIGGSLIEFETVTNDFGEGRIAYGERVVRNPLVNDLVLYYVAESVERGTRLTLEVHYRPKPFPLSLLAPLFRRQFGKRLPGILSTFKEAAEAGPPFGSP